MSFAPRLLDLPTCVILQLLQYLDATSLYLLGKTCTRLDEIIRNSKTLWKRIDARRAPNDHEKTSYCIDRCHKDTHTFLLRADSPLETLVSEQFYTKLNNCETLKNIVILALENQTINGEQYKVTSFPPQLEEFSLKKTKVLKSLEFFKGSGYYFEKLRVLILDECNWVTSVAFMPIAKYPALEILSLYKCKNVEDSIPYLGLASCGFKQLRIIDARLTPLRNFLVRSLHKSPSLLAIYLQNCDITYKIDYFKRKLAILKGAPTRDFYIKDTEFDTKDTIIDDENGVSYQQWGLDDKGLLDYLLNLSSKPLHDFPKSVLYLDPYNPCTCSGTPQKNSSLPDDSSDSDDDQDDDDGDFTVRELSNTITRLTRLSRRFHYRMFNYNSRRSVSSHPTDVLGILEDYENNICVMNLDWMHLNQTEDEGENNQPIIDVRINPPQIRISEVRPREVHKRLLETVDGPERKRQKTDDTAPGPSGLQPIPEEPNNEYQAVRPRRQVNLQDFPMVQIEHINNIQKDTVPLRRLSLRGYSKITDTALQYIKNLDLEVLDLTYTNVSVKAIEDYLVEHPSCRIVHERFCTCPTNLHF